MTIAKSLRWIPVSLMVSVFLLASGCGGGGGGSGDDDFPTPRLPADAATFDAGNAGNIANTAVGFVGTLDTLAQLKGETAPSIPLVTRMAIDRTLRRTRNSTLVAARSEDLSADLCIPSTPNSAVAEIEESGNSASGSFTFSGCNIDGSGIVINGSFAFIASANGVTMDYSFQAGGALTVSAAGETITIEMNLQESGNDGTGDFSTSVSFSLSGIPDSGFLVTTEQPWVGNALNPLAIEVTDGQLIVHGASNTRLSIEVTGINTATVELDEGSGFAFHSTFPFTP